MELTVKIMNVITSIIPRTSVRVEKKSGAYIVIIERTWLGRTVVVEVACKEAVTTQMSLLDLL